MGLVMVQPTALRTLTFRLTLSHIHPDHHSPSPRSVHVVVQHQHQRPHVTLPVAARMAPSHAPHPRCDMESFFLVLKKNE